MFRLATIISSSVSFDLLVYIVSRYVKTKRLTSFSVFYFFSHSFNPDPRVRNTFWSITMGGTIALLPVWAVTQYFVQRYLAVKTLKEAKRSGLNNRPRGYSLYMLYIFYAFIFWLSYCGISLSYHKESFSPQRNSHIKSPVS